MTTQYELTPRHRKSFGKKALVTVHNPDNPIHILTSYTTDVASYQPSTNTLNIKGWYSQTTARHINAFLAHHNLPTMTKQEMEEHTTTQQQPKQQSDGLAERYYSTIQKMTS